MDQFETMLRRALRHWRSAEIETPAESLGRIRLARALTASQKGRPTLLEGWLMPRPWALIQEFMNSEAHFGIDPEIAEAVELSEREWSGLRRLGESFQSETPWGRPMDPAFGPELCAYDRVSLHDGSLVGFEREGDKARIEFSGFYTDANDIVGGLMLVFQDVRVRALWKGRQAVVAPEGSWRMQRDGSVRSSGWLARARMRPGVRKERLAFQDVPYVNCGQFSEAGEGRPELRVAFRHDNEFELALSGASVEAVVGADAIVAYDERKALERSLPALPVEQGKSSRKRGL